MGNVGAQFGRAKVWGTVENLLPPDLNAEFNNILNNLFPAKIGGNSATLAQMQATSNPGAVGSENLQTTLQGELQTLRFMIGAITGGAQWYSAPTATLSSLGSSLNLPQNRVNSGRVVNAQPMFLVPAGSAATVTLKATTVNFTAFLSNVLTTYNADITSGSLSLAPSSNNTCLASDATLTGAEESKYRGEHGTFIPISNIGSSISSLGGTYQAFKNQTTGEIFIAYVDTVNSVLRNAFRGYFFNSADAWSSRQVMLSGDVLQLLKITYIFATNNSSTLAIDVTYNAPTFAVRTPSSPALGDYFYNLNTQVWSKYTGSGFVNQTACLIGLCVQDTSNTVAARSFDFYNVFQERNNIFLEYLNATTLRAIERATKVSVYGTEFWWNSDQLNFNSATDMESGVTLSANTLYFLYVTNVGEHQISNLRPYDRTFDLLGWYHPSKPWRCVGHVSTDNGTNFINGSVLSQIYMSNPTIPLDSPVDLQNFSIAMAGGTSATFSIYDKGFNPISPSSPFKVSFRNPNATTGNYVTRYFGNPLSISVPTGSSLGLVSGYNDNAYLYLCDDTVNNGGQLSHGFLAIAGSRIFDEGALQSTTLLNAASTSRWLLYATTAHSGLPVRLLGQIQTNQSSVGNWAASPVQVAPWGLGNSKTAQYGSKILIWGSSGVGSNSTTCKRWTNNGVVWNYGPDITYNDSSTGGAQFLINSGGLYSLYYSDYISGAGSYIFGFTRNASSSQWSSTISGLTMSSTGLGFITSTVAGKPEAIHLIERLNPGDVIRTQDDGTASASLAAMVSITKIGD